MVDNAGLFLGGLPTGWDDAIRDAGVGKGRLGFGGGWDEAFKVVGATGRDTALPTRKIGLQFLINCEVPRIGVFVGDNVKPKL